MENEINETPPEVPAQEEAVPAAPVAEAIAAFETESPAAGLDIGSQAEPEPVRAPLILRGKLLPDGTVVATGRRKTSVARVRVKKGDGKFTVNERPFEDFFRIERDRLVIEGPLKATGMLGQVDVWVRVNGGGTTGQAGAIVLGVARALQAMNPDTHGALSDSGYLTRDGRMVERKKYGHRKARRSFQFSKR